MKPETLEWINKAEADWRTMLRESVEKPADSNFISLLEHALFIRRKFKYRGNNLLKFFIE